MIVTQHIRQMLEQATRLAELCEQARKTEGYVIVETREGYTLTPVTAPGVTERRYFTVEQTLERAANLARHAAAELDDELHQARGWH